MRKFLKNFFMELTRGHKTAVDEEDYEWLALKKWFSKKFQNKKTKKNPIYYAARTECNKTILMHRAIMNCPKGMEVDHINGDTLDNRKVNLRICTSEFNTYNRRARNLTSSYKGVSIHKLTKKWQSQISYKYLKYYIGLFEHEVRAAKAYDDKARELFGEFARLNFPYRLRRRNIYRWLMSTNGRVFSVTFIKRSTGKEKTIRARLGVKTKINGKSMRYNTRNKRLIVVFDMQVRKYKCIPIEGIEAVSYRGRRYRVD